jgi:release factor glutamine methyltransferase
MENTLKINQVKTDVLKRFLKENISKNESMIEIDILIEHVFGFSKKDLIINPDISISEKNYREFNLLVDYRIKNKIPVQYLTNKAYFMGREFYVDNNVLIPRPETEILVEEVLKTASKMSDAKIIDVGTGSGCIAVITALNLPKSRILGSDISQSALDVAKINAEKHNINNITFIQSDVLENTNETFDIIVSNPPYIPISQRKSLQEEVVKHEPHTALFVEDNIGVEFYEKIGIQAFKKLNQNGFLMVEIGFSQSEFVTNIFKENKFREISVKKDLSGIERIVTGKI